MRLQGENVANALRNYAVYRIVRYARKTITSNKLWAGTATRWLVIRWSCLPTFPIISSHAIGGECETDKQGDRDGNEEIRDDKERTPTTVQMSPLMTIDRRNYNENAGYMVKL